MKVVLFCHSLLSDWNHGNAHFLRGIVTELVRLGHEVEVFEPEDAWSVQNLVADHGEEALTRVRQAYPALEPTRYARGSLDLDAALEEADVVIVHEWSDHDLVARVGEHRAGRGDYLLFFHDTHHRAVTDPESMRRYDLRHYDAVLAFGKVLRDLYLERGWAKRAYVWHEAADTRVFTPRPAEVEGDVVWVGNFGDDERTAELEEFLLGPVRDLGLRLTVYGVRYPDSALEALERVGARFGGYLPNHEVPAVFGRHRVTVHVPRRPYARALPGIPTIRPFEAMACGIPLVSAPWDDAEGLFSPGETHLVVRDRKEAREALSRVLSDPPFAERLARRGLEVVRARHGCEARAKELLAVVADLGGPSPRRAGALLQERA